MNPIPTELYVLPFDHQTGLWKAFDWQDPISPDQEITMRKTRMIIYQGYLHGIELGIPKSQTAILTDDRYGNEVLSLAKSQGTPTIYTLEKSGQEVLTFTHDNWQEIVREKNPHWIKTLVRYNPTADSENLSITRERLKQVSDFAREHGYGFMIEPLVIPTHDQLSESDFDHSMRPNLTVKMITEIYEAGIYPTIWKIEGSDDVNFYHMVSKQIHLYDTHARIVVLGRNESMEHVENWITTGALEPSVIGFAVGRTVFLEAIQQFINQKITEKESITIIGENYYNLYKAFNAKKESLL